MERIKCITFDKAAQDNLPQHIKDKMKADKIKARKEMDSKGCALFDAMGKFATEKFPDVGSIEHLKKLKHEADEAIAEPQNLVEYADCLLALFGAVYKAGFTYEDLLKASEDKLEIVKKRNWKRLSDGTYQHCP